MHHASVGNKTQSFWSFEGLPNSFGESTKKRRLMNMERVTDVFVILFPQQEDQSMDQILEGLLDSGQPEGIKAAIINRICEQGAQPSHPTTTVKGVLEVWPGTSPGYRSQKEMLSINIVKNCLSLQ